MAFGFLFSRWCAEGGKLICCDYCNNAFCKKCILRNLGRKELSGITDENSKWHCYVCRSEPLQDLVSKCHRVIQKQEDVELKQQKTEKTEREKKQDKSKSPKEHKAVANGKEHVEGSGTMTFFYKNLQVPKELIKKAKKLVETTTGLNHTFIQFIQQATDDRADKSIRYRHLKAFKAVLSDLKKAHDALEEALKPEFRHMELQNGTEEQHVTKITSVVEPAENDQMDGVADLELETDAAKEVDKEQKVEAYSICQAQTPEKIVKELPDKKDLVCNEGIKKTVTKPHNEKDLCLEADEMEEKVKEQVDETSSHFNVETMEVDKELPNETDLLSKTEMMDEETEKQDNQEDINDEVSNQTEMQDHQTETDADTRIIKTEVCDGELLSTGEMSLDHDIMSVPPSVPEELFQMVESLAGSSMLSQTDNSSVNDTKSNENPTESQRPQPKVKNLIVKLTPVPVVKSCGSRSFRSKSKEEDADSTHKGQVDSGDKKTSASSSADTPPPTRRSARVKTTPLRKQMENQRKKESSESESEEDKKDKSKLSKKSSKTKNENGKLSKQAENRSKKESSESDSEDDGKDKSNSSKKSSKAKKEGGKSGKQAEEQSKKESSESESEEDEKKTVKSSKTSSNAKNHDVEKTETSDKTMEDSDSDEIPPVLLEKTAAGNSSDEEQESTTAKKCLRKSNSSTKDTEKSSKRKRKSESSDSDGDKTSKKTSKKKKKESSDSSGSDYEQEKGSKRKAVTARRRSSRTKKQNDTKKEQQSSPEKKVKRSYEKKHNVKGKKASSKIQFSSSEDEEEDQDDGGSGEDSDEQKIRPIVEDNIVGGSGAFHQSSGKMVQLQNPSI